MDELIWIVPAIAGMIVLWPLRTKEINRETLPLLLLGVGLLAIALGIALWFYDYWQLPVVIDLLLSRIPLQLDDTPR